MKEINYSCRTRKLELTTCHVWYPGVRTAVEPVYIYYTQVVCVCSTHVTTHTQSTSVLQFYVLPEDRVSIMFFYRCIKK
jgi:hypothetical protein